MLFLVSMGKTGLSHDFFFEFSLRPFEVVEVKWKSVSKFWGCDLEIWQSFLKLWLLTSKCLDLCMTNGSKVLIYLTFLYFIFYCTLVSNAKGNLAKSNKSELWNRLSYRGLPYHFEVRSQSFRKDCKSWRSQRQKFNLDFHSTSTTSKGLSENSKKMSWVNPVFPIDTKNSIGFFVQFFLG